MFAGGIGVQEIVIILIVGLLVFGAARLPKIARSLGQGIKEFKKTVKGLEDDDDEGANKVKYVQNQPPNYQQYPQGPQYQQGPVQQPYTAGSQTPNTQQNPEQNQTAQSASPQDQQPGQSGDEKS